MESPGLARRLGTGDAVVIGLGSMIGAGVFSAFGPAAQVAGAGLLVGLAIAAVIALCNATASAQLAARFPLSGGTYVYGREQLGPWWGYLAGWGFVVGKTASCAAMALTVAAYVAPPAWQRPVAVAAVVALVAVNYRGITRTAALTKIIVSVVLVVLATVVVICLSGASVPVPAALMPTIGGGSGGSGGAAAFSAAYGVLQSAGLLFFAFAGYARIATLGEEVRAPERTIPRAILGALGLTVVVYALVGISLLLVLGPDGLAAASAPVSAAVEAAGSAWARVPVQIGAAMAALGALLALIAGVGRTTLAMARENDLPRWLSAVHPRFQVPYRAELCVGATVCLLVLVTDLRQVIGFSSFGVLVYYLIANLAAYTQGGDARRYPRWLQVVGVAGCALLALTLPWSSVLVGAAVLLIGMALRFGRRLAQSRPGASGR